MRRDTREGLLMELGGHTDVSAAAGAQTLPASRPASARLSSATAALTDPATGRGDNEPGGMALFLAGSAMGSAGTGADRFGTRFFQAMREDRFGMRRGPAVGQHFFQIRVVRMQAE